jgi:drug/metabolite transporter (DMT)-like permease
LGAALAWGLADYAGGLASRRIPAIWTSIGMQASGAVLFAAALVLLGRWPALDGAVIAWGTALAMIGAGALLFLYRGLALGPIAVVSPISAGYSAITVILVVVFLGERVSVGEAVAIAVTFAGIALASTDLRQVVRLRGRPLPGVPSALVAMVGFGAWGALMTAASRSQDELALILVGRGAGFLFMTLLAVALRSGIPSDRRRGTLLMVLMIGAVDTIANVLFVFGVASGAAAIVATASGMYPVVPAVLAIVFLGERLAPNQYAGVVVLIAGLVALGSQR